MTPKYLPFLIYERQEYITLEINHKLGDNFKLFTYAVTI